MKHYYSVYDFYIQSNLILTGLIPFSGDERLLQARPVIQVVLGAVSPHGLPHPTHQQFCYQATAQAFWLDVPFIARFLVTDGDCITIEPVQGIDEASLLAFLFGPCFDALLRQRALFFLPGFALQLGEHVVSMMGYPSVGYGMLQGTLFKQGFSFFSGSRVVWNSEGQILPGVGFLELCPQVVSRLALETSPCRMLRPGIDKYILPLGAQYVPEASPLHVMYLLKPGSEGDLALHRGDDEHRSASLLQQTMAYLPSSALTDATIYHRRVREILASTDLVSIHLPMSHLKLSQVLALIVTDLNQREYAHV